MIINFLEMQYFYLNTMLWSRVIILCPFIMDSSDFERKLRVLKFCRKIITSLPQFLEQENPFSKLF